MRLGVALAIDAAVRDSGVIATVGFRERYRPLVRRARELFAGRAAHARRSSCSTRGRRRPATAGTATSRFPAAPPSTGAATRSTRSASSRARRSSKAQAFWGAGDLSGFPPSQSLSFVLESGATATLTFMTSTAIADRYHRNSFSFFHRDGVLSVDDYDAVLVDGAVACTGGEFDPWLEQDRAFIEAVRRGDPSLLASDYHDGIRSLAPILAAWESARSGGAVVDVAAYAEECAASPDAGVLPRSQPPVR